MRVALALSGGGARGAYQVGALRALAELFPAQRQTPFSILVGASAGAITSSFLAARANAFPHSVARLVDFWSHIRPEDVFRTDAQTLAKGGLKWERINDTLKHVRLDSRFRAEREEIVSREVELSYTGARA